MLSVRDLVVGYRRRPILHGVSMKAAPGGVTLVLGPNGSGKSTLIKTVAGVLAPWEGGVRLDGREIGGIAAHRLVREGLCLVPQGRVVFPFLTVDENLQMSGFTVRDTAELRRRIEAVYAFFPGLVPLRRQEANRLSGGQQAMLALGKALVVKPRLLLLDEPSLGLSPRFAEQVYERVAAVRATGTTVVMVEQNVHRGLQLADRVVLLAVGRKAFEGSREELQATGVLERVFFGSGKE